MGYPGFFFSSKSMRLSRIYSYTSSASSCTSCLLSSLIKQVASSYASFTRSDGVTSAFWFVVNRILMRLSASTNSSHFMCFDLPAMITHWDWIAVSKRSYSLFITLLIFTNSYF